MPASWLQAALRRGAAPLGLGLLALIVSWPATEDLDRLLKGLGLILVVLGLVIVVATARTLSAEHKRLAGQAQSPSDAVASPEPPSSATGA